MLDAGYFFVRGFLVVFKFSHPIRPDTGPAACVELSMPLQFPQLLKPNFSDRPIQKNTIYTPIVSVDAKMAHFPIVPMGLPLAIVIRRRTNAVAGDAAALIEWPASSPHAVQEHGYVVQTSNINSSAPVPLSGALLNICVCLVNPAICAIAAFFLKVTKST